MWHISSRWDDKLSKGGWFWKNLSWFKNLQLSLNATEAELNTLLLCLDYCFHENNLPKSFSSPPKQPYK